MSRPQGSQSAGPVTEGVYVATRLDNNVQVGYDTFAVRETAGGVVVDSKHVVFGGHVPTQTARFEMDPDWTPRRADITVGDSMSAVIEFDDAETRVSARSPQGERLVTYPTGRHRAYFFMNGSFYFPMHIVRRFDFNDPRPQGFDLALGGLCEVRRAPDVEEDGETFRRLEMRWRFEALEDQLTLMVNGRGDLVSYRSSGQNLLVKLEEGV